MFRFILAATLAWLLAGCAQPGTQAPTGAADPQATVPATRYQPTVNAQTAPAPATRPDQGWRDANATVGGRNPMQLTMPGMGSEHQHGAVSADTGKTAVPHEHHAGMDMQDMQGMQCMAGGSRAGKDKAHAHAGHADMAKGGGCCCGHDMKPGQPAACNPGGTCGCCNHEGAT